ncbi:MAG: N-acetylmuramyl-L-alanine amidase, negative regulator of AmpC, AmpD [Gemmatimonadetes bacterium]|nr:N-acetylmuramyl-L-alanine amidase, negative regulator of AmpC, AmpD [Gemmatimonadota bacterium]
MHADWTPSPNFAKGRKGFSPIAIVIHIMQGSLSDTDSWFATPKSKVSAHYGISRTGVVHQYVAESDTAWHAGTVDAPTWPLITTGPNPNLYTLGIEHEGQTGDPWPEALYATSAALVAELAARWSIPLDREHIIRHAEIRHAKHFCPGRGVDLDQLIARARNAVTLATNNTFVGITGSVTARSRLNIRRAAPNTIADVARVVDAASVLSTVGWTSTGESLHGNSHWYRDGDGNYFWAGATDQPTPMV